MTHSGSKPPKATFLSESQNPGLLGIFAWESQDTGSVTPAASWDCPVLSKQPGWVPRGQAARPKIMSPYPHLLLTPGLKLKSPESFKR